MSYLKATVYALVAGLALNGVWAMQDANYYLGTTIGVLALFGTTAVISSNYKKGNR